MLSYIAQPIRRRLLGDEEEHDFMEELSNSERFSTRGFNPVQPKQVQDDHDEDEGEDSTHSNDVFLSPSAKFEKLSDQTKQGLFQLQQSLMTVLEGDDDHMPKAEMLPLSSLDSIESDDGTPTSMEYDYERDWDLQNMSDEDLMIQIDGMEREQKQEPNVSDMEPEKEYIEQEAAPQSIVVQTDALQKAMDLQAKKRRFPSLFPPPLFEPENYRKIREIRPRAWTSKLMKRIPNKRTAEDTSTTATAAVSTTPAEYRIQV